MSADFLKGAVNTYFEAKSTPLTVRNNTTSSFSLHQGEPGLRGLPGPVGKPGPAVSVCSFYFPFYFLSFDPWEQLGVYESRTEYFSADLIGTAAMRFW